MPLHQTPILDPLSTLLQTSPSTSVSTDPSAIPSLKTIQTHATNYRWADVLSETSNLLTHDASSPHETLLLQTYRILALVQSRQIQRAKQSISTLGDLTSANPLYTYQHYPQYEPKSGTFIPFLLRFLSLDIRFRTLDATAVSDALHMLHNLSAKHERVALLSLLTAYALKTGFRDMAIDYAEMLAQECTNHIHGLLTLSIVYLHLYDIENAERVLETAENHGATGGRLTVCKGLIAAAKAEYQLALKFYEHAIDSVESDKSPESVPGWWICAMNNSAICMLQLALLPDAVRRLEQAVCKAPERALQEGLVFNLATLYQLAFPDSVRDKKKVLRKVTEKFGRQGFDLEGVGL